MPPVDDRAQLVAFLLGAVLLVLGQLAVASFLLGPRLSSLDLQNAALETETSNLRLILPEGDSPAARAGIELDLKARLRAAQSIAKSSNVVAVLPAALALTKPATGWWTHLSIQNMRLELKGQGMDPEDAAAALDGVRETPCLTEVSLGGVRREKRGGKNLQSFTISAKVLAEHPDHPGQPCEIDVPPPAGRDPFLSSDMDQQIRRRTDMPPLRRFPLRDLRLVNIEVSETASGGKVVIRTPEGQRRAAIVGSVIGDGRAQITQILPDMILLSEDRVVDEETGAVRTRAFTMELETDDPDAAWVR
jgi:hypothetical protein